VIHLKEKVFKNAGSVFFRQQSIKINLIFRNNLKRDWQKKYIHGRKK